MLLLLLPIAGLADFIERIIDSLSPFPEMFNRMLAVVLSSAFTMSAIKLSLRVLLVAGPAAAAAATASVATAVIRIAFTPLAKMFGLVNATQQHNITGLTKMFLISIGDDTVIFEMCIVLSSGVMIGSAD